MTRRFRFAEHNYIVFWGRYYIHREQAGDSLLLQ